jgi:hypothetical protein
VRKTIRLTFKLQRFESLLLGGVSLVLTGLVLAEAWRLLSLDLGTCATPGPNAPSDCAARQASFDSQFMVVVLLQFAVAGTTVLGGLVLGVGLVGRELERGTLPLAWTLATSRGRWLWPRFLIVAVAVVAVSALLGLATEPLSVTVRSSGRVGGFEGIELRAPVLALRALAALCLGLLVGAVVGRALPGVLLAAVLMPMVVLGVNQAMDSWLWSQSTAIDVNSVNEARIVDTKWRDLTTGRVLERHEYLTATPPPGAPPDWDTTNFEPIPIGVPDSRSGDYVTVESLVLGGVVLLLMGGAFAVVHRRAPD